jgi:hypothetical protein
MKSHSSQFSTIPRVLTAVVLSLSATLAHANAVYDAFADASLNIDSIINMTNQKDPNDLTGLLITGDVLVTNEGSTIFGNALATYFGDTILLENSDFSPVSLYQSSGAQGNAEASPLVSIAESNHSSLGTFNFSNNSPTDIFQIEFSLKYNLAVNAAVTNRLNETATAEAFVRLIDDLLRFIPVDETLSADALGILALTNDSLGDTQLLSITLAPGEFDRLSLNVSAQGRADPLPVPEPAIFLLLGSSLAGLICMAKRRRLSVA